MAMGESVGIVDHGTPVPTNRIAADLQRSREATLANLEKLEARQLHRARTADSSSPFRFSVSTCP